MHAVRPVVRRHMAEILSPEGHVDATDIHTHKIDLINFNIKN